MHVLPSLLTFVVNKCSVLHWKMLSLYVEEHTWQWQESPRNPRSYLVIPATLQCPYSKSCLKKKNKNKKYDTTSNNNYYYILQFYENSTFSQNETR